VGALTTSDGEEAAIWDAQAASFDDAPDHGLRDPVVRAAWRALLLGELPPAPARVADLGCGTGTLSVLLAAEGYAVDGVDLSPAMVERAVEKAGGRAGVAFVVADAADPPLAAAAYDVVLCRHVLWALPEPSTALRRWAELLRPDGRLVLVEGRWWNDAGLSHDDTVGLCHELGLRTSVRRLDDPALWGGPITDERYLVAARTGDPR
jgi:SAM-dependent methyltransferase